jgi:hypothetical protein
MSNPELESEILSRLVQLETSVLDKLTDLQQKLDETRLLLPDLHRYGKLQDLLKAGQWKEADIETTRVIQELASTDSDCTPENINSFCCNATRIVDRLWRKYSQEHFGFSIQLSLYQELGGNLDTLRAYNNDILNRLGEKIGWYRDKRWLDFNEFDFSGTAPLGSLPGYCWYSPYRPKISHSFLMRLIACDIISDR